MSDAFYIDYPQERVPGEQFVYRCVHCKKLTTEINGRICEHEPSCQYRKMHTYFEIED